MKKRIRRFRLVILVAVVIVLGALIPARLAAGQTVTFNKLVDSFDRLPDDRAIMFNIPGGTGGAPAPGGDSVVFRVNPAFTGFQHLWTAGLSEGSLTRLADQDTAIPDALIQ